jgi:hypothetical protein
MNEPILISYKIKNTTTDTIEIWHCGFWCNNRITVTDFNNTELQRTQWGKTTLGAFSPGGNRNKNFPITLAPNETDSAYEQTDLKKHFIFNSPGVYNVTFLYHETFGKSEVKIQSNSVTVELY